MAFDDALFQLGMDLTRSSTAQKEDHYETVHVFEPESRTSSFEHDDVKFAGTHLILDLFGAKRLDEQKHIERTLKRCVELAGATLLHIHLERSPVNGGISAVALFDNGQANIRTWPERAFAAVDVMFMAVDVMFMARDGAQRERLVGAIEHAFSPSAMEQTVCRRAKDERRTAIRKAPTAFKATAKAQVRRLRQAA